MLAGRILETMEGSNENLGKTLRATSIIFALMFLTVILPFARSCITESTHERQPR